MDNSSDFVLHPQCLLQIQIQMQLKCAQKWLNCTATVVIWGDPGHLGRAMIFQHVLSAWSPSQWKQWQRTCSAAKPQHQDCPKDQQSMHRAPYHLLARISCEDRLKMSVNPCFLGYCKLEAKEKSDSDKRQGCWVHDIRTSSQAYWPVIPQNHPNVSLQRWYGHMNERTSWVCKFL